MDHGRSLSVNFRMILARICVAIWIFLSVPVVVYSKYILDKKPPINPYTARVPIVIRNPLLQPPLPPPPPTSPTAAGYGGGCLSQSFLMKILSYIAVPIWIFISFTLIVYNKYILDNRFCNWPFPISLTLLHLSFCATLAAVFMKLFKLVEPVPAMSRNLYISSVVPVSALYSLSLCLSNSAFIYLSLSLIQILKLTIPVAVYAIGVLFRTDEFKIKTTLNMLVICSGVAIASYWEAARFGIGLQLGGIAFEAARSVMIRILLTSRRVYLNPITSVYYIAPCSFAFLLVPWFFLEYPALIKNRSFHLEFLILGTNSLCPFALNLAAFLLAGKASALTIYVAAVVRDWSLIGFSWLVIKDRMAPMNLVGYSVAFVGVAYYNYKKQQGLLMARQWQRHDELGRSLLEEGECQGNGRAEEESVPGN